MRAKISKVNVFSYSFVVSVSLCFNSSHYTHLGQGLTESLNHLSWKDCGGGAGGGGAGVGGGKVSYYELHTLHET